MVPRLQWLDMSGFWMNVENICGLATLTYLSQKSQRDWVLSGHDYPRMINRYKDCLLDIYLLYTFFNDIIKNMYS